MKKGTGITIMMDVRDESLERRKYKRKKIVQRNVKVNNRRKRKKGDFSPY